jgi:hypothetical protein
MTNMTKDQMVTMLQNNACRVTFTKGCGCGRETQLTLQESVLPAGTAAAMAARASKEGNKEETIDAWDMFTNSLRTFKVSGVTVFNIFSEDTGDGSGITHCVQCDG